MKNYIFKVPAILGIIFLLTLVYEYKFNPSSKSFNTPITKSQTKHITPLSYTGSNLLNEFNKTTIDNYPTAAGTYDLATMASQITSQLTQAFSNAAEKPLPLVANWNVGIPEYSDGLDPMYMINRLANGEHIVPTWKLDAYFNDTIGLSYYEESIKKAVELGLPLVFILPSPESALTHDDVYFSMDKTNNPNVITTNGTVLPKLSPFGPNNLWNEVGEQWSTTSLMAQLQEWYPNPPLVLFIDTDNSKKLLWSELIISSRYTSQYPADATDEFKRTLVNAKWIEKYRQLHQGFKNGFVSESWKRNTKFISRNQLALNMGTTSDWQKSVTTTNLYANIWPLTADGLTIDFNLDADKTDTTNAPHTLLNNLPFMLDQAKVLDSNFTYQLSINANEKVNTPQRYRGFTQFVLWFLRPSIIRQTPNKSTKDEINPLFQQVVDSVELVNGSDILADFWKNGKLVKTGDSKYNLNIPAEYQSVPREFLLKTDASSTIWAFALEKGLSPNREWLIYVQSPEGNLTDITLTVPDVGNILVNSSESGNFYSLNESTDQQTNTLLLSQNKTTFEQNTTISSDLNYTIYDNPFIDVEAIYKSKNINTQIENKGNTYYVNSINGNDSFDGLSPSTAWKTLKKARTFSYHPGDSILFKRGNIFHEISYNWKSLQGDLNNYITLGAYGNGKQPIITLVKKQNLTWILDNEKIWKASVQYNPQRILQDGLELVKADSLDSINEKYKWFYSNGYLYIYSVSDPSSSKIEFSTISNTLFFKPENSYIIIQDLNIQGGSSNAIVVYHTNNIIIKNCTIGKYSHKGITILGTQSAISHDINISNNIVDSAFRFKYDNARNSIKGAAEGIAIFGVVKNVSIEKNLIADWGHSNIVLNAKVGEESVSDITIKNNYITSPNISYGGRVTFDGETSKVEFSYNIIKDIFAPNQLGGHNNHISHNIFDHVHNSPLKVNSGRAITLQSYLGPIHDNLFEFNTILNSDYAGVVTAKNLRNGDVYNNIFKKNIFLNNKLKNIIINRADIIPGKQEGREYNNTFIQNVIYTKGKDTTIGYKYNDLNITQFNALDISENNLNIDPQITSNTNTYIPSNTTMKNAYGAL